MCVGCFMCIMLMMGVCSVDEAYWQCCMYVVLMRCACVADERLSVVDGTCMCS